MTTIGTAKAFNHNTGQWEYVDRPLVPGEPPPPSGTLTFVQNTPSAQWVITHSLGFQPNVTIVDSAGDQVEGDVEFGAGVVTVTFSGAFSGTAHLS